VEVGYEFNHILVSFYLHSSAKFITNWVDSA